MFDRVQSSETKEREEQTKHTDFKKTDFYKFRNGR